MTANSEIIVKRGGQFSVLAAHEHKPPLYLPPHPLMSEGHNFENEEMFVTLCGKILPSAGFSKERLEDLARIAMQPELHHSEEIIQFAIYLLKRGVILQPDTGCWELPLKEAYDEKGRARYPHLTSKNLGFYNLLAHRATIKFLRGADIEDMFVDHLCRNHACCNPYHLEAVPPAVNSVRGAEDRRHSVQPRLGQCLPGALACELAFPRIAA